MACESGDNVKNLVRGVNEACFLCGWAKDLLSISQAVCFNAKQLLELDKAYEDKMCVKFSPLKLSPVFMGLRINL
jgi:hypothetical protein